MAKSLKNIRETLIVGPDCQERFLPLSTSHLTFLREHGVNFAGMSTLRGQYEIRRNNNQAHLVLYTLGGKGWLRTDNKTVTLEKGQVWISAEGNAQEYGLKGEFCKKKTQYTGTLGAEIEQPGPHSTLVA